MSYEDKSTLRRAMLEKRRDISDEDRHRAAFAVGSYFTSHVKDKTSLRVAAYMPIRGEIDPHVCIAEARRLSFDVSLPVLTGASTMDFRIFEKDSVLVDAGFSTLGPDQRADVIEPDLILMPLVAFDRRGTRLGYGKGFYDRYLARRRAKGHVLQTIGLAYALQEVSALPCEPHDVLLNMIITEKEVITIS